MRWSLRTQLVGVSVALLVLLTVGALHVVYYRVGQQVRRQAATQVQAAAQVLTTIFDRTAEQLRGRGRVLLELPSLRAALTERPEDLEPLLQEVKAVRAANLLWATDAQGRILASTGEYPAPGHDLVAHPLVSQALAGQPALGFDWFLEDWWLTLSLPVTEEGTAQLLGTITLGLLLGEAYLTRLAELLGTEVAFFWQGHVFWSPQWPAAARDLLAGRVESAAPGAPQELVLPGQQRLLWVTQQLSLGADPLPARPRTVLGTALNESVIFETARAIGWVALAVISLGTFLLIGAIRSLTQPLKTLVADSQRVSRGELTHTTRVHGAREIAELAASFNHMLGRLRESRESLLQEKLYTDRLIQQMLNSLVVADMEGYIQVVNPATLELLGYEREGELIGQPLSVLFAKDRSPVEGARWHALLQQGSVRNAESAYRTKHGQIRPVLVSGAVLRGDDNQPQGVIWVAQDITERKQLDHLKDAFISTVSHELRTPLTSIQESVSLIEDGVLGPTTAEQRQFLAVAHQETHRMRQLVDDLLDLSALASGRLILEWGVVDVHAVLQETLQHVAALVGTRRILYHPTGLIRVRGDRERISQIVRHLLQNALQFTPAEGAVTLTVQPQGGMVALSVQDQGPGIAKEDLHQVFDQFVQLGRTEEERSGGVGVGLTLCKGLVELHGGTITIVSDIGQGTTVTLTLPAAS
jgi:two-component system sensor histidine kinase VicK